MNQFQLFILITICFFTTPLHAGMAFMGFKTFEEDSTTLYKTRNLGDVQLQKSVITSHSYNKIQPPLPQKGVKITIVNYIF